LLCNRAHPRCPSFPRDGSNLSGLSGERGQVANMAFPQLDEQANWAGGKGKVFKDRMKTSGHLGQGLQGTVPLSPLFSLRASHETWHDQSQ
jgi:hypothetical protein